MPAENQPPSRRKSSAESDPALEKRYRVRDDENQLTLAAAVRKWQGGEAISWSRAERLIKARHVVINGNLCIDPARRLKTGELVKVLTNSLAPMAAETDVVVRHLDHQVVVIEKPSGMTSVRHADEQQWSGKRRRANPTLEDFLPRLIAKKLGGRHQAADRPGDKVSRTPPVRPVHRLDRDTSGLMIFARTVPAERSLGEQFKAHTTHRKYLAVVAGDVKAQKIDTILIRDRGDGRRGSAKKSNRQDEAPPNESQGKRAVTHIRPIEKLPGYTLIECQLETGRTHQIRIHLAELGHPLCGEKVYGRKKFDQTTADTSGAPRLALHAAELGFKHPASGAWMQFVMPLPRDLRDFVERLRTQGRAQAKLAKS